MLVYSCTTALPMKFLVGEFYVSQFLHISKGMPFGCLLDQAQQMACAYSFQPT